MLSKYLDILGSQDKDAFEIPHLSSNIIYLIRLRDKVVAKAYIDHMLSSHMENHNTV